MKANTFNYHKQNNSKATPDRIVLEYDVEKAAIHEAGHFILAKHFGLEVRLRLWRTEFIEPDVYKIVRGQCAREFTTAFQTCCIGWAGHVSEMLMMSEENISAEDVFETALDYFDENEASATDLTHINGHPQKLRALRLAAKVMATRRGKVQQIIDAAKMRIIEEEAHEFVIEAPGRDAIPQFTRDFID